MPGSEFYNSTTPTPDNDILTIQATISTIAATQKISPHKGGSSVTIKSAKWRDITNESKPQLK